MADKQEGTCLNNEAPLMETISIGVNRREKIENIRSKGILVEILVFH